MASTNKTSNLELSQFIATDTPTWLVDYNGDMVKIDAGVGRVEELAETASTQAVGVANGLQATNQTVTTLSGQVANVQNQANSNTASVNGINQRLGNTDISGIGDGTITGAIRAQNSNLSLNNYSTEETVVGTWIDGKPIYRKCYTGTPNLSNTIEMEAYTIPNSINCNNIDTLVNVSAHYRGTLNGTIAPFTYYRSTNTATTYDIDASGIRLFRYEQALYSYVVIVEYTKA